MDILNVIDWKVFIAFLALILSQLPPVRQMLKGKNLRMAVAKVASFQHTFGNTNIILWIDLENIGGRTITISLINCSLSRQGQIIQTLTAGAYLLTESLDKEKPIQIPPSEIALKQGERWSGYIQFWDDKAWTKGIESRIKSLISKARDDINSKVTLQNKQMAGTPPPDRPLVEVSPHLVQEINGIVKSLQKIDIGDYELSVAVYETIDRPPLKILRFDLTIFDTDFHEIFEDTEDYKYGFGIHLPSRKLKSVAISMRT